jgi:uncharacterized protein (DUF58 family)
MLSTELLRRIRRIEIRTSRLADDLFAGTYHSVFHGRGMEFSEVREYHPGDDVRTIDWNVTARAGKPHVKKYVEERELTVILVIDASGSQHFGSAMQTKAEQAAEIAAILAFSAIRNNDKVGLVMFTDQVEKFIPPRKGRRQVLRLIREILYFKPRRRLTAVGTALEYVSRIQKRRAVIFVISDFADVGFEPAMRTAAKRHDLIAIRVSDPREGQMPPVGLIELEDAETGRTRLVDLNHAQTRVGFAYVTRSREEQLKRLFQHAGASVINVSTAESPIDPIAAFFDKRRRMR